MPGESAFRLSVYLTLAGASASLGYAEAALLPVGTVIAGLVLVALAALYWTEDRLPLLSIPAANRLGLGIGAVAVLWLVYRVSQPDDAPWMERVSPEQLLPALGPVLLVLMPAKLLRKEKHTGDYWGLYAAGLAAVALAGAMAEDAVCFILIGLYAVSGVWSLALFFLVRSAGMVPPVPTARPAPDTLPPARVVDPDPTGPPPARREFARSLAWVGAAAAVALPLFLLTPRSEAGKFDFGRQRMQTGYAADQMVDLNRAGTLQPNPEPAFEVTVTTDDGRPKDDFPADQRWRGNTLGQYDRGAWHPRVLDLPRALAPAGRWSGRLPDLGPGRFRVTFDIPAKLRSLVLTDPVVWAPGEPPPVLFLGADGQTPWYQMTTLDSFFPTPPRRGDLSVRYVQVTRPLEDPDLGPGFHFLDPRADADLAGALGMVPDRLPKVKAYADQVLGGLIEEGRLPEAAGDRKLDPIRWLPLREYHEAIAREFARHLSGPAGLTYTTDLQRVNKEIDPVEEFLFHTKAGHCERFASALVLMLRSQGIPALLVLGFKGCDPVGNGRYVVRQEHAHAWAEALISRPSPFRALAGVVGAAAVVHQPARQWHWLSLDPSPAESAPGTQTPQGWWDRLFARARDLFDEYIARYSTERRERALLAILDWVSRPGVLAGFAGVVVLAGGVRALRRQRRSQSVVVVPPEPARWFDRLLALLAAHRFRPGDGETPREFAARVGDALRSRSETARVAGIPAEWVEAYYEARFGGVPLPDDRKERLEARFVELATALKGRTETI
jgi:transglutaminase-like putative cysteine protease